MEKKELYHFHKIHNNDEKWKEKNEIIIPEDFNSTTFKRIKSFTSSINIEKQNVNYFDFLDHCFNANQISKNDLLYLLKTARTITINANEFKREMAMEDFRRDNCNSNPSRLHSIYLTDEQGIEYWSTKFGNSKLTLYRVEASGDIFKTNEQLIPDERLEYGKFYEESYKYWNPNFKKVPKNTNEYLVQGRIKILEKIPFN